MSQNFFDMTLVATETWKFAAVIIFFQTVNKGAATVRKLYLGSYKHRKCQYKKHLINIVLFHDITDKNWLSSYEDTMQ